MKRTTFSVGARSVRNLLAVAATIGLAFAAATPAVSDDELTVGKNIYQQACAMCHQSGMAGAPRLNRPAEWALRVEKPLDDLIASTLLGRGNMPPQSRFGEDEVRAAIKYILSEL